MSIVARCAHERKQNNTRSGSSKVTSSKATDQNVGLLNVVFIISYLARACTLFTRVVLRKSCTRTERDR